MKGYAHLEQNLPSNFGFGTGYEFKESILVISPKNENSVHEGNTFCVITSLKNLKREDGFIYSMQLSDTIIVRANKNVNLTSEQASDYGNIAYDMSGEAEDK